MASKVIGLDLSKRDGFNKAITGRVGDKEETYSFRLFNNGVLFDLNQAEQIALLGLTPSGYYVDADCFPQSDGTISVSIPSAFNAEMGYFQRCFVRVVTKTGETLSTQDLIYYSYGNADISAGTAQDYIVRVETLVDQINQMADQLEEDLNGQFAQLRADLTSATNDLAALETKINNFMNQFDGAPLLFRTTQITTQDWNTIKTSGIYSLNNASGANRPNINARWGRLEVITNTTQRYTSDTGELWIRAATGSPWVWGVWKRLTSRGEVYNRTEVDAKIAGITIDTSGLVNTTTNQTIGGAKTFTEATKFNANVTAGSLSVGNVHATGATTIDQLLTLKNGLTVTGDISQNGLPVSNKAWYWGEGASVSNAAVGSLLKWGYVKGGANGATAGNLPFSANADRSRLTCNTAGVYYFNFSIKQQGTNSSDTGTAWAYYKFKVGESQLTTAGAGIDVIQVSAEMNAPALRDFWKIFSGGKVFTLAANDVIGFGVDTAPGKRLSSAQMWDAQIIQLS